MSERQVCVGLMSGTSVDGIDAALVAFTGHAQDVELELLQFATYPYPPEVRNELLNLYEDETRAISRLSSLNVVLGELFGQAVLDICAAGEFDV